MERTAFLARSKPNHFRIPWVEVAGALTSQWSSAQRGNVLTPAVVETVHCKVTGWLSALWDFPISFPSKWQDLKFGPFSDAPADKTWKAMCSQMSTILLICGHGLLCHTWQITLCHWELSRFHRHITIKCSGSSCQVNELVKVSFIVKRMI